MKTSNEQKVSDAIAHLAQQGFDHDDIAALADGFAPIPVAVKICHQLAVNAGWWSDLETGEPQQKDLGDTYALIASEVSEAFEGWRKSIPDDHLPHRPMVEVELADTLIRVFDMAGGFNVRLMTGPFDTDSAEVTTGQVFMLAHASIASAFMHHWFDYGEDQEYPGTYLGATVTTVTHLAEILHLDVWGALVEKLAYNTTRADHTREARLAAHGKKV